VGGAADEKTLDIWWTCNRAMQPRNATAQCNRAISSGILLPQIKLRPSLPDIAQRFSSLPQSLPEFHQRLHGLIRRLMEFIQSPKDANQSLRGFHQPLLGFIQQFFALHQSLREANQSLPDVYQSLKDANQPSFTPFLPKTTVFHYFSPTSIS
jgi:hypothetical protein